MNLYQTQHSFYCGIDLHANQMYACVIDQAGKKHLHRNFKTRQSDKFFADTEPLETGSLSDANRRSIVRATRTWYWLADACALRKIPFVLGHALYLKAIHGGKVKNDKVDCEKLVLLLRGGNFTTAFAYPKELCATRDLLPRRTHLVRRRAQTLTHIQIINHQWNLPSFEKKLTYKSNRASVPSRFENPSVRTSIELLSHDDDQIRKLELFLEQNAKLGRARSFL